MTVGELVAVLEMFDPSVPVVMHKGNHGHVEVGGALYTENAKRYEPPDHLSAPTSMFPYQSWIPQWSSLQQSTYRG